MDALGGMITEWIRKKIQDPQQREDNEAQRIQDAYDSGKMLTAQRKEKQPLFLGYFPPHMKQYIAWKQMIAKDPAYTYTFQLTSKANCYQSVLDIIEKRV
jgi:hypothetical protein